MLASVRMWALPQLPVEGQDAARQSQRGRGVSRSVGSKAQNKKELGLRRDETEPSCFVLICPEASSVSVNLEELGRQ